ncbi:MAG: protein-L-isoaspartate(D-aspartate) O-methyltransferase [Pseudomonadales bacterium]
MTSRRTRERLIERLMEQGISNYQVLELIRSTPRHMFLDEALSHRAYEDVALPIGYNQTISQPYIVARMTEILMGGAKKLGNVLEIGTGCGYQTAILSRLSDQVLSVERIRPLQEKARKRLSTLKCYNVQLRHADGGFGWPAKGPFDAILSAAAPREVPSELLPQLADGGRLVTPIGDERKQHLVLVTREGDEYTEQVLEQVNFVPFLSGTVR